MTQPLTFNPGGVLDGAVLAFSSQECNSLPEFAVIIHSRLKVLAQRDILVRLMFVPGSWTKDVLRKRRWTRRSSWIFRSFPELRISRARWAKPALQAPS